MATTIGQAAKAALVRSVDADLVIATSARDFVKEVQDGTAASVVVGNRPRRWASSPRRQITVKITVENRKESVFDTGGPAGTFCADGTSLTLYFPHQSEQFHGP